MSVDIIRLSPDNAQDVYCLEKLCFPDSYSITSLTKDFSDKNNICYGAYNESVLLGYFICTTVLDEAELQRIAVKNSSRGKGIATAMIDFLVAKCLSKNISYIFLEVRENNMPARNLYEKHNFIQTGLRKNYYRDNGENAVLYTLSVNGR